MVETVTPEEIREIRGMYGLTQKAFAQLLGIGTASMVRYEQGAKPSKANANLIRAAKHPQFMRECLERDGELIPNSQRERASQCIYALVSLEPGKSEETSRQTSKEYGRRINMTMDEMYHYTIQQEVLNEQAANLVCDLMEYMLAWGIDANDATHPVSALLKQLLELKKSLLDDDSDDDTKLEQIRGHFKYMKQYLDQLQMPAEVA